MYAEFEVVGIMSLDTRLLEEVGVLIWYRVRALALLRK